MYSARCPWPSLQSNVDFYSSREELETNAQHIFALSKASLYFIHCFSQTPMEGQSQFVALQYESKSPLNSLCWRPEWNSSLSFLGLFIITAEFILFQHAVLCLWRWSLENFSYYLPRISSFNILIVLNVWSHAFQDNVRFLIVPIYLAVFWCNHESQSLLKISNSGAMFGI